MPRRWFLLCVCVMIMTLLGGATPTLIYAQPTRPPTNTPTSTPVPTSTPLPPAATPAAKLPRPILPWPMAMAMRKALSSPAAPGRKRLTRCGMDSPVRHSSRRLDTRRDYRWLRECLCFRINPWIAYGSQSRWRMDGQFDPIRWRWQSALGKSRRSSC